MNIKHYLSSAGLLFFLLLFSKPYVARCQAPTDNEPTKKVVRIAVDTVLELNNPINGKKTAVIENDTDSTRYKQIIVIKEIDGGLPKLSDIDINTLDTDGQIIIIEKDVDDLLTLNDLPTDGKPVLIIQKEIKIIKTEPRHRQKKRNK